MTFEEKKAEEWLQSIEGDDCVIITDREERKQAYIAGFKEALKILEVEKMPENKAEWLYLENDKFPENYRRVLITVLDDEGKRVVVSGMFVTKIIKRNKKTKKIWYWLYDSDDVFVTSGSPGECSKPIAWMPFPEPCGART